MSHMWDSIEDNQLEWKSRNIFLPEILLVGTEEGIKALSTFLKDTNAFKATGRQTTPKETPRFEEQPEPPSTDDEADG
jgi:hypothetical protein